MIFLKRVTLNQNLPCPKRRQSISRFYLYTFFQLLILSFVFTSVSIALPARSTVVIQKGLATTNSAVPWVSGWDLQGNPINLKQLLSDKSAQGIDGLYVILCATWSNRCKDSLNFLQNQKGGLAAENIDIAIIFTEDITPISLKKWLGELNITTDEHYHVIIDRYHRSAIRMGAYEELLEDVEDDSANKDDPTQPNIIKQEQVKRLRVPMSLVLSPKGVVLTIITQEGTDLIQVITKSIRYAGH